MNRAQNSILAMVCGGDSSKSIPTKSAEKRKEFVKSVCDSGKVNKFSIEFQESRTFLGWKIEKGDTIEVDCNTEEVTPKETRQ